MPKWHLPIKFISIISKTKLFVKKNQIYELFDCVKYILHGNVIKPNVQNLFGCHVSCPDIWFLLLSGFWVKCLALELDLDTGGRNHNI